MILLNSSDADGKKIDSILKYYFKNKLKVLKLNINTIENLNNYLFNQVIVLQKQQIQMEKAISKYNKYIYINNIFLIIL